MKDKAATVSFSEAHESVDTSAHKSKWRRLFAFIGPAYLVSVGYMDPGNWATDIAGGSQFGYALIWVLLMSNLIALLMQSLSARLGIVHGRDLAQASRETFAKPVNISLYILAEIAIAACDLAEVLGMAIGIHLLFPEVSLLVAVCITVLDTFLLLFLINYGIRKIEAFIFSLISIIGMAFLAEMIFAKPVISDLMNGFIPSLPEKIFSDGSTALYIAIGIIGATVMPHNLYLHSSLVQTRKFNRDKKSIRRAINYNIFDSAIALNLAFFVNAAILILAASTFYTHGMFGVAEIQDAHKFLEPMLGSKLAPALFAIALICAGQSSTLTGTLAGQIIMEGYLNLRIQPWIRRLITRLAAIVPALITIIYFGEAAVGKLLVLSQVILSLQLGFAIIPLIHFVSDKTKMKDFVIPVYVKILAWICAIIIVGLNAKLVYDELTDWINSSNSNVVWFTGVPIALAAACLLIYIIFKPFISQAKLLKTNMPHPGVQEFQQFKEKPFKKIAISVDFSGMDLQTINSALSQGGKDAEYLLVHIVESAGAILLGSDIADFETGFDKTQLNKYLQSITEMGYKCSAKLGYGNPKRTIPVIVNEYSADLLVMGAHGHRALKDILLGTTVDAVRHRVTIPVLIVRSEK